MQQQMLYFDKVKKWDLIYIISYLIFTAVVIYNYRTTTNLSMQKDLRFWYPYLTQLFFGFLGYRSLRNLSVFCFWVLVGFFHLYIYLYVMKNVVPYNYTDTLGVGFRNTLILLGLYQILRFISLKTQHLEYVCPYKIRAKDILDERYTTWIDYLLFFIYLSSTVILLLIK